METTYNAASAAPLSHPVDVHVAPQYLHRNRLTCAFRPILAIPHLLLVGGPLALVLTWATSHDGAPSEGGVGAGVLGAVAIVIAILAWFAIVFTGKFPRGLWTLSAYYMRWRVRALAYVALLRDEYPPFGEGAYPASLGLPEALDDRDRVSVAFRLILVIPQLFVLWFVNIAWMITTVIAWIAILFTGAYPKALYDFSAGVLRWNSRVEAYMLLLRDEYPPFSLEEGV